MGPNKTALHLESFVWARVPPNCCTDGISCLGICTTKTALLLSSIVWAWVPPKPLYSWYQLSGHGSHQTLSTVGINFLGMGLTKPALQVVSIVWAWVPSNPLYRWYQFSGHGSHQTRSTIGINCLGMGPTETALQLVSINVHGEYCPGVLFGHSVPFNTLVKGIVQCKGLGSGSWLFYLYMLSCVP
jgi:hypothetical protein